MCWCAAPLLFEAVSRRSARPQLSVFRESRCNRPPWRVTSTRTISCSCIPRYVFFCFCFIRSRPSYLPRQSINQRATYLLPTRISKHFNIVSMRSLCPPGATYWRNYYWWTWSAACRRTSVAPGCKDAAPSGEDNAPRARASCVRIPHKRTS